MGLPEGYSVRPATMEDVEGATDLFNACEIAETGEPDYDLDELRGEWTGYDLANVVELVVAPDGMLAGSMTLTDRNHVVVEADGYVHPDHSGVGIGTFLVRRSETRAQRHIDLAPPEAKVVIRNWVNAANPEAGDLLRGESYQPKRHFRRMGIDITDPPAAPDWPEGFDVRPSVAGQDEPAVFAVIQEAFRDHWSMGPTSYEDFLQRNAGEGYDPDLWFQVVDGASGEIAAVASNRVYGEAGWVRYLGVRAAWRRRGLGEALLRHTFGAFHRRGFRAVELGVDAENLTGATRLYERVGMKIVRTHSLYEKVLRDGEDWPEE